jgi:hypothetical protein
MFIYSGNCRFCETGIDSGFKDLYGKKLYTGDIVILLDNNYFPTSLTIIVRNDYHSYSNGVYVKKSELEECFVMGIKSCAPENIENEGTSFSSGTIIWKVKKVKSFEDIVSGEKWKDYGFNYKED